MSVSWPDTSMENKISNAIPTAIMTPPRCLSLNADQNEACPNSSGKKLVSSNTISNSTTAAETYSEILNLLAQSFSSALFGTRSEEGAEGRSHARQNRNSI